MARKTKKLYAVFAENIYRHACGGIFTTVSNAITVADEQARQEKDDHHDLVVYEYTWNTAAKGRSGYYNNLDDDGVEVYRTNRSRALAKKELK